jgi:catechol 2,3-dioxygenase-like lactoylglutathione lyase family enzyme
MAQQQYITLGALVAALTGVASTNLSSQTPARDSLLAQPVGAFFALSVADVDRTAAWYRDELGLSIVTQGEALQGSVRFALLQGQGTVIELLQRRDARPLKETAPGTTGAYQVHGFFKAGLNVRDIDALYARMQSRNVPIAYVLERAKDLPLRSFSVRDPEGNMIQFFGR